MARADELGLSRLELDRLSGLPVGYSGKLLGRDGAGPKPKRMWPIGLEAMLGADASLVIVNNPGADGPSGNAAVVSLDGTQVAFVAQPHGGDAPRLYVRRLDQLTATPLAGTEGAVGPFFSPDGQWLGFFGGGRLKKIAVIRPPRLTPTDEAKKSD